MQILVTGGAGYVGSVLIPSLLKEGHQVKCLDRFFFGDEFLSSLDFKDSLELIKDDIRWFDSKILDGVEVVMDLAALSNDPVGELDPEKTYQINHKGRERVAQSSKLCGIKQYILASSASIYGQQDSIVDEESQVNPLTAYSKANRLAEQSALSLNDNNFGVTILRFSSIYGLSPRMRFDLAVNSIALDLYNTGKIVVHGKNNKRPFLHIKDAVKAYLMIINSSKTDIAGEIFNVGSNEQNYSIYDLAREVGNSIGIKYEMEVKETPDNRSYVASFDKIRKIIGFKPDYTVSDGSREIYDALKSKNLIFDDKMITLRQYKKIISDPELIKEFNINGKIL